jgi:signal transduction histidine kinase
VLWPSTSRFLTRLRASEVHFDERRPELVIATSRAVLAAAALFAVYIEPTNPPYFTGLVRLLVAAYLLHSTAIWARLRMGSVSPAFTFTLHVLDIIFPIVVGFFSGGPGSPFFLFLPFAIVWSAFRWGAIESLATAAATIVTLVLQTYLITQTPGSGETIVLHSAEPTQIVLRCLYLAMLGAMLGLLGEREKEWRAEDALINRLLHGLRAERSMTETMLFVVREFMVLYGARKGITVVERRANERYYQFHVRSERPAETTGFKEIFGEEGRLRMLPDRPSTFFVPAGHGNTSRWLALDGNDQLVHFGLRNPAHLFGDEEAGSSMLAVSFQFGREWAGRLLLMGARLGPKRESELRFAEKLMQSVSPAIYSAYLVRRLRNRAGALERARVARELHDGVIQSLISVEMQVDVLRRQAASLSPGLSSDLGRVQELLREEVLEVRELMQQLKPAELTPDQFIDFIANSVEKFRRDTGIDAQFTSDLHQVNLTPQQCRELARIVQEALVNIRKHSGASSALVGVNSLDGSVVLTIEDNGRGFNFSGRMDPDQLTATHAGPTIIQERVSSIAGELEIESTPGQGARLQITVAQKGHRAHG